MRPLVPAHKLSERRKFVGDRVTLSTQIQIPEEDVIDTAINSKPTTLEEGRVEADTHPARRKSRRRPEASRGHEQGRGGIRKRRTQRQQRRNFGNLHQAHGGLTAGLVVGSVDQVDHTAWMTTQIENEGLTALAGPSMGCGERSRLTVQVQGTTATPKQAASPGAAFTLESVPTGPALPPKSIHISSTALSPRTWNRKVKQPLPASNMQPLPLPLPERLESITCGGPDLRITFAAKEEPDESATVVPRYMLDHLGWSRNAHGDDRRILRLRNSVTLVYPTGTFTVTHYVKNFRVYPEDGSDPIVFDAYAFPLPEPQEGMSRVSDEDLELAWSHDYILMGSDLLEQLRGHPRNQVSAHSGPAS